MFLKVKMTAPHGNTDRFPVRIRAYLDHQRRSVDRDRDGNRDGDDENEQR
ncbi:MAG: hypothetical protein R6W73_05510 [Candidatus Saliniplasma sp.]